MDFIYKKILSHNRSYIIAELSANHGGQIEIAKKTILAMKESGADAVKVQTYTPSSLTMDIDNEYFGPRKSGLWKGRRPYELYAEASMPWEWQPELQSYAKALGLDFFSSPFDFKAIDFLEGLNVPMYKIASFEITDVPLIRYAAEKQKPMIISTGVADLEDIELAKKTCLEAGNDKIIFLKCTSAYPAPYEDVHLNAIPYLKNHFNVPVGLSDHTLGIEIPVASVVLGAQVIEKHFIIDRKIGGPDSAFSLEPHEFKAMVSGIRNVEKALGPVGSYIQTEAMKDAKSRSRSLFYQKKLNKGHILTNEDLKSVRSFAGVHTKDINKLIGKVLNTEVNVGQPASLQDIK